MSTVEQAKERAAREAVRDVTPGQVVGLGTGSTAALFVRALAERCEDEGLSIVGVPTSRQTEELARSLGLPLRPLEETSRIDVIVDGADRVDPALDMVKGGGGALLWEKLAASVSARRVYVVDWCKQVPHLGRDFPVPVEVVPAAACIVSEKLRSLALEPVMRRRDGRTFLTDSGNVILDCYLPEGAAIAAWESFLKGVTGVVDCGLFVGMVDTLIVGTPGGVERIQRGMAEA